MRKMELVLNKTTLLRLTRGESTLIVGGGGEEKDPKTPKEPKCPKENGKDKDKEDKSGVVCLIHARRCSGLR